MKGLVLYELYKMKAAYMKNLLMVGALYLVLSVGLTMDGLLYMLVWMMGFYSLGSLALDEKWNRFARALPVNSKQLAGAKFMLMGAMIGLGAVYALVTGAIVCAMLKRSYAEFLFALIAIVALELTIMAIVLPCAIKWGVDKARNTMSLIFAALFGCGLVAVRMFDLSGFTALIDGSGSIPMFLLIAVAAVACVLGWLATARVYQNKEA